MTKVVIVEGGKKMATSVVSTVSQPTVPEGAPIADVGLVEITAFNPTELIPGPVGPQGPQGVPGEDGTDGSPDTAAQVLAKLITVDGSGSALDSDLLDGQSGSYYLDYNNQTNKPATYPPTLPIPWSGVSGAPATYPPSAHGHPFTEITGVITDAQHGARAGGTLHAVATPSVAGFIVDAPNDGTQYVRKNVAWTPVSVPPGTAMSDTPPVSPTSGQLWYETDTGNLYVWYEDGTSAQWVQINNAPTASTDAPADGNEYVRRNGVWRLKSQTLILDGIVAPTGVNVAVPTGAKFVKFNGSLAWNASASNIAGSIRLSIDGTTFLSGAGDYVFAGDHLVSTGTAVANTVATSVTAISLTNNGAAINYPVQFSGRVQLAKAANIGQFVYSCEGRAISGSTLYQNFFQGYTGGTPFNVASTIKALQFGAHFSAGTFLDSYVDLEWVY